MPSRHETLLDSLTQIRALLYVKDFGEAPGHAQLTGWLSLLDRLSDNALEILARDESKLKDYLPNHFDLHKVLLTQPIKKAWWQFWK